MPPVGMQQEKRKQGTVDLQAHGIFRTAEIVLELQMLLDPFEEQLDLPALLVECSDLLGASFGFYPVSTDG